MNAEIVKDVGGSVAFDAPQLDRPTSATVTVYEPDGSELIGSAAATVDSCNTTIHHNVAAGATSITLISATGVDVGRHYVITASDGRAEWFRVAALDGLTVTLAEELAYSYEGGDAVTGTRLTVSISAANAADLAEGYVASWVYTSAGEDHRVNTFFDVVRSRWADIVITPHDFKIRAGDMALSEFEALDAEGLDFADDIKHATELVRIECASRGFRPALFLAPGATFKESICQRVLTTWAERGSNVPSLWQDDPLGYLELRRGIYEAALNSDLNSANFDANEDAVVTSEERATRLGSLRIVL